MTMLNYLKQVNIIMHTYAHICNRIYEAVLKFLLSLLLSLLVILSGKLPLFKEER